jgi:hypothetical protein
VTASRRLAWEATSCTWCSPAYLKLKAQVFAYLKTPTNSYVETYWRNYSPAYLNNPSENWWLVATGIEIDAKLSDFTFSSKSFFHITIMLSRAHCFPAHLNDLLDISVTFLAILH